jgi:hypothetical protein
MYRGKANITTAPRERGVGGRGPLRDPGVNAEASGLRRGARGRAVYGTAYHRAGLQPRLQAGDGVAPRERGVGGRGAVRDPGVNAEASGLRGKARDDDEPKPPDAHNSRKGERGVGVSIWGAPRERRGLRRQGGRGRAVHGTVGQRAGLQPRLKAGDSVAPRLIYAI